MMFLTFEVQSGEDFSVGELKVKEVVKIFLY